MSETQRKTLLVIDKGVHLNGDAYKKLADAGYVVVRGDPTQFHVVETFNLPPADGDILAQSAFKAVRDSAFSSVREQFVKDVLKQLLIRPEPPKVKP